MADPVVVVGGGPAGLLVARGVRGRDVVVFEASGRVGWPPHCTGIVSPATAGRLGVREAVGEVYECAVFHGPGWGEVCRVCGSPLAVRVRRPLLEEVLVGEVEGLGHVVARGARVEWFRAGEGYVEVYVRGRGVVRGSALVVAGGASFAPRRCRRAVAVEVRARVSRRVEEDSFHTFHLLPGSGGGYGWLVPVEGGRWVLVGAASLEPEGLGYAFEAVWRIVDRVFGLGGVESRRGGLLVLGPAAPTPFLGDRVLVFGDAACTSKPFTGGGLYAISVLAPAVSGYLDGGLQASLLMGEWGRLVGELRRQFVLARLFRLVGVASPRLALRGLRAACSCGPDFDEHSTALRVLGGRGC